jgi:4-hydroxy-3-methylbut-2-enyl diphosphate reductase
VIIVGDKNHSEVRGINGYVKNKSIIIENEIQAKKLGLSGFEKVGVVAQTTQNLERFNEILKILKNKVKKIKYFNNICPEVINRQKELNKILEKSDGILVIGSYASANTRRLVQIGKVLEKEVIWINSLEELKKELSRNAEIKKISALGVISGTSAPDWEIKKIYNYLCPKSRGCEILDNSYAKKN